MPSVESQLRAELAHVMHALERQLDILVARLIAETEYPSWIWQQQDPLSGRRAAGQIIRALDYQDGQDPHHCRIIPGIIGASPETLSAARAVNLWANRVKAALAPMTKLKAEVRDPNSDSPVSRSLDKVALTFLNHPRFHKRQALRTLTVFDQPVAKATFFWAKLPKIQKFTKAEVMKRLTERLERNNTPALQAEMKRLQALSDREPLAEVKAPHIHPKVNLVLDTPEGVKRLPRRASLPVLHLSQPGGHGPEVRALPDEPPPEGHRLKRSDIKVESEVFLPSLHMHRYLPAYRNKR